MTDTFGTDTADIIDVWAFDLEPGLAEISRLSQVLSAEEQARAERFLSKVDGDHFRVSHGRLRHLLASYVDIPADTISFSVGARGKPAVVTPDAGVFFNLSHSGDVGVAAVSRSYDVGVDIERERDVSDGLAERFFSSREVASLQVLDGTRQHAAFFRCWTRKEAFVKATGEGIGRGLNSFDVSIEDSMHPAILRIDDQGSPISAWALMSFEPKAGYFGALAARTNGARVDMRLRWL